MSVRIALGVLLAGIALMLAAPSGRADNACAAYGAGAVHEDYWGTNLSFVAQDTCTVPNISAAACQARGGDPMSDKRLGDVCFLPATGAPPVAATREPTPSSPVPATPRRPDLPNSVRLLLQKYHQACDEAYSAKDWDTYQTLLKECQFLADPDGGAAAAERQAEALCLTLFNRCSRIDATTGIIPTPNPTFARYKQLSDFMNCKAYGGGCQDRSSRNSEFVGDLNLLVNTLDAIERQAGAPVVPPGLKTSIVYLRNIVRETNNIDLAVQRVNQYLDWYRRDIAKGCADPDDPPPNACTAKVDRRWLGDKIDYALNWQNRRSVIRDETNQIIDRWAAQLARQ